MSSQLIFLLGRETWNWNLNDATTFISDITFTFAMALYENKINCDVHKRLKLVEHFELLSHCFNALKLRCVGAKIIFFHSHPHLAFVDKYLSRNVISLKNAPHRVCIKNIITPLYVNLTKILRSRQRLRHSTVESTLKCAHIRND